MIKSFASYALIMLASVALASAAQAHTISIGVYNAGGPGDVTLAMGTYDHGSPIAQGAIQLIAGPGTPSAIVPFSSVVTTKPIGLIDGVNNFYADAVPATWGALSSDSFHQPTNTVGLGPVVNWQQATFTGLAPGAYTYQLSGMTSANWNNINSFQDNWTGTIVISAEVAGVPEPASITLCSIMAVGGLACGWRRRKQAAAA
jgi:hypothetical protein